MKRNKKVLVTGGAGFIGHHLAGRLLKEGHYVTILDNFKTGSVERLQKIGSSSNLTICKTDVSNIQKIKPFFKGVDWVFHLAALADIVPSIEKPLDYYRSNVTGTISVMEAARLANVKRFVYAASSSCYGIPDEYPTQEDAAIRPQYPYALTKYLGEEIVLHWYRVYGLPVVSLRLFNVFGPGSRTKGAYGAVFGVFLRQKLAGKPFTVVGDGTQTRDFTYVSDVVEAFICAAKSTVSGEVFNVGSGNTYSINYLVKLLGGDTVSLPKRPGEPDSTFANISKIKVKLGWVPQVSFEKGVKMVLERIEDWKDAPLWNKRLIAQATHQWFLRLGSKKIYRNQNYLTART